MTDTAEVTIEDGRRARRDRNKYAVVDAFLELVRAGNPRPSVAEVAERSGVSHRSVFRYFEDKDQLARTAIERQQAFAAPLIALTVGPGAPLDERIQRFVERRIELFEHLAPVARLSRSLVDVQPVIAAELANNRHYFRNQIEHLFGAELDAMPRAQAAQTLAVLDVICSFESTDLLLHDQGLSRTDATAALERAVRQLLAA
ncbi:MAG: TetR/AcrR family transcriptional regulator [Actinobacteria bacterium]|nr:TetR/AcrR family transcriptional regulator [Actinomycetota bacterium]